MDPGDRIRPRQMLPGPRPPPLRVSKDSVVTKSNNLPSTPAEPAPESNPSVSSPKVISTNPGYFVSIVQHPTGWTSEASPTSTCSQDDGCVDDFSSSLEGTVHGGTLIRKISLLDELSLAADGIFGEKGVTKQSGSGDIGRSELTGSSVASSGSQKLHGTKQSALMHRIYGREMDLENVVKMLLTDSSSNIQGQVSIVPIIGQDGIGKTTLAKLVYNDRRIRYRFDIRGWVPMSKGIDIMTVTKELIMSFSNRSVECVDFSGYQDKLTEEILGKRFLIVLDDVSSVEENFWCLLLPRLIGARSAQVLATTRHLRYFTGIQMVFPYRLSCLSTQDSFSIFKEFHPIIDRLPNLSKFCTSIVEKCTGVPLSVKVLGGVLNFQKDEIVWSKVLDSDLWVHTQLNEFDPALMVAFHYMPSALKQCFAVFSLFTNQHVFSKDDMVLLWMSLNHFLPEGDIVPEKNINSYFDDFVSASIIEKSDVNGGIKGGFVIHNLLYDLAQTVCGEEYLKVDDEIPLISGNVRYLSIIGDNLGDTIDLRLLQQLKDLRMLQIINRRSKPDQVKTKLKLPTAESLKHLCVLIINNIHTDELPVLIGNFRQLSYLSLRNTGTKTIPKSVLRLYNLLYLDLMGCPIRELPNSIHNLKQLRSLSIRNTLY